MAITATHKASRYSGSNAASYATLSAWTPTANRLVIASVTNELSGTPTTPTLSGNGLTWSQLVTYLPDNAGTQVRITVFVAKTGGSPSNGVTTADFGGVTQLGCTIIIDEIDGADISGTALQAIVQNKTGSVNASGTSESISLTNAITSGNASYGTFNHQAQEDTTPGSGYTELGDGSHAGPSAGSQTEYKSAGSQTVDASWTTSIGKGGIALEIKASSTVALVIQNAGSTHTSDNPVLVQHSTLTIQNSLHAHISDNLSLVQHNTLQIQNSVHVHESNNVQLTTDEEDHHNHKCCNTNVILLYVPARKTKGKGWGRR